MKNISGLPPPPSTPSPRVQTPHSEACKCLILFLQIHIAMVLVPYLLVDVDMLGNFWVFFRYIFEDMKQFHSPIFCLSSLFRFMHLVLAFSSLFSYLFTALASLLGGISLSGANSGFTATPESQQNITELLNMLSATPTPSTTPLPSVMTTDPIANMFSNQTSPTQGKN